MEEVTEKRLMNVQKLDMSAVYYSGVSEAMSRYFSEVCDEMREQSNVEPCPSHLMCVYCKSLFHPGNHRVRFTPRRKVSKKALKFLDQPDITQKMKRHLADNARKNKTYAVITCGVCNKKTKLEGFSKPPKKVVVAPVIQEAPKVLSRKEKKKMKKKKNAKKRGVDNAGLCIQSPASSPALNTIETPILPKAIKVSEIMQPVMKVKEVKKTGKSSKGINKKLQGMLQKETQKQQTPSSGLQGFLSSLNF